MLRATRIGSAGISAPVSAPWPVRIRSRRLPPGREVDGVEVVTQAATPDYLFPLEVEEQDRPVVHVGNVEPLSIGAHYEVPQSAVSHFDASHRICRIV